MIPGCSLELAAFTSTRGRKVLHSASRRSPQSSASKAGFVRKPPRSSTKCCWDGRSSEEPHGTEVGFDSANHTHLRAQCNGEDERGYCHARHEADSEKHDGRATAKVERPARAVSRRDE